MNTLQPIIELIAQSITPSNQWSAYAALIAAIGSLLAAIAAAFSANLSRKSIKTIEKQHYESLQTSVDNHQKLLETTANIHIDSIETANGHHKESLETLKKHHKTSELTQKHSIQSEIVLSCLNQYIEIHNNEALASENSNEILVAFNHHRAMADLLWTEFELWKEGHIQSNIFAEWLEARKNSYTSGDQFSRKFPTTSTDQPLAMKEYLNKNVSGNNYIISYKRVWVYLSQITRYFPAGDFKDLMSQVHTDSIPIASILKKVRDDIETKSD